MRAQWMALGSPNVSHAAGEKRSTFEASLLPHIPTTAQLQLLVPQLVPTTQHSTLLPNPTQHLTLLPIHTAASGHYQLTASQQLLCFLLPARRQHVLQHNLF